ncbi:MAG: transglutaminase family protein [Planctomycetota bacterium]
MKSRLLLKLTHRTQLDYTETVTESVMELRVMPRQEPDQRRLSFNLAVGPPSSPTSYVDWLGNTVHALTVNAPHRKVVVEATSYVETRREKSPAADLGDPYDAAPPPALHDFVDFGGPVVKSDLLQTHLDAIAPQPGEPIGAIAGRIMNHIFTSFTYEPGVTTSASPITDLLEGYKGVCQDFTHLMLGLSRALGIPARYVSGLVHPMKESFRGFTQTHAWCELLVGPNLWVGFDPTNNTTVGPEYVKIAIGRDYRDVPPNKGVYRGGSDEMITATVESEVLDTLPTDITDRPNRVLDVGELIHRPHVLTDVYRQAQQQQQ